MNHQRPLSRKKAAQMLVIMTILAWATETMIHQLGYGQEVPMAAAPLSATPDMIADDKFVSGDSAGSVGGTLELRSEAIIVGNAVQLKQICRWSKSDAAVFGPVAELTIARLADKTAFRVISVADIRQTLHDAGVNLALVDFAGATSCTVTRSDSHIDEHTALEQWIDAAHPDAAVSTDSSPTTQPQPLDTAAAATPIPAASIQPKDSGPSHSLRQLLTDDVCQRLNISPEAIEMNFNSEDEKVLGLAEPYFKFDIASGKMWNLGPVWWDVTIFTATGNKKVTIRATARAWETQVVVAKPLPAKQMLHESDFTQRRVLADSLPGQPLLRLDQCAGQSAAMDLAPGTIMTGQLVEAVSLVRAGQLITVTLTQGSVQIKSVARALEAGTLGQTIKVRNDAARDVFEVTITGDQEARLGPAPVGSDLASAHN